MTEDPRESLLFLGKDVHGDTVAVLRKPTTGRLRQLCSLTLATGDSPSYVQQEDNGTSCIELTDYCREVLQRGNPRWAELLFQKASNTPETEVWRKLRRLLTKEHPRLLLPSIKSLLHMARGMSLPRTKKKKKKKQKAVIDTNMTVANRLIVAADMALEVVLGVENCCFGGSRLEEFAWAAHDERKKAVDAFFQGRLDLLEHAQQQCNKTQREESYRQVAEWVSQATNEQKTMPADLGGETLKPISSLFPALDSCQASHQGVLFSTRCGSDLYGVALEGKSDVDHYVVYLTTPSSGLLALDRLSTSTFTKVRGASYGSAKGGEEEYTVVELGNFLKYLLKGGPTHVELLFAPESCSSVTSTSMIWKELVQMRHLFLTQRCIRQYFGFVIHHLHKARELEEQGGGEPHAVSKALYHAFTKLMELKRLLRGSSPKVRLEGEELNFVLGIRRQEYDLHELMQRGQELLEECDAAFQPERFPEEAPLDVLEEWLYSVRLKQL